MSRPLMYKTARELEIIVERNRDSAPELDLVLSELKHRKTLAAEALEKTIRQHLQPLLDERSDDAMDDEEGLHAFLDRTAPPTDEQNAKIGNPKMSDARRWTEEAVAGLRTKLLDLTKRNPLISFKHGGRSTNQVRIVDERPDLLFEALQDGAMGFEPLPDEDVTPRDEQNDRFQIAYERARLTDEAFITASEKLGDDEEDARELQKFERALRSRVREQLGLPPLDYGKAMDVKALALAHGFDPSYDLKASDDDDVGDHHRDTLLRVLLPRKELDKRLKNILDKYHGHQRDTGLHTLFLVLGFVQWFEDETSDVALHAPLLLLSVELERRIVHGRYEYQLRSHDEPPQVNIALVEKLKQIGIDLPAELREGETPESYFIRANGVLAKGRRLSLRRFATLAVLPFPRMVLWKDLDPTLWPEGAFADHEMLPCLLGAKDFAGETRLGETIDIDAAPWADTAPPIIQPADASQHSAVIDAVEGHSLAIEGPPGTGKSQTITNIVAAALAAGKKVLFVAEKQAALTVVANRLRKMGFGSLLLELHGDNVHRQSVYDGLRHRIAARPERRTSELEAKRAELKAKRDMLRRYLSLIKTPLGSLDRTAHWLAWREISLRERLNTEAVDYLRNRWRPDDSYNLTRALLAERRDQLNNFATALAEAESQPARTVWLLAQRLPPFDQRGELELAAAASNAAAAMNTIVTRIEGILPVVLPRVHDQADDALSQLAQIEPFENVEERIAIAALVHGDLARTLLARQARWRHLVARLTEDVSDPAKVDATQVTDLLAALDAASRLDTVAAARGQLAALHQLAADAARHAEDCERFIDQLGIDDTLPVEGIGAVAQAFLDLGNAPADVAALYGPMLLEPVNQLVCDQMQRQAVALVEDRAELRRLLGEDTLDEEPGELRRTADVLADSGFLTRLFGAEYRRARKRTKRLVQNSGDREADATLLRRAAKLSDQIAAFARECPVSAWLPSGMWRGIDANWAAVEAAVALLRDTHATLAAWKTESALDDYLAMPSVDRLRLTRAAAALPALFASAASCGFGAKSLGDLRASLDDTIARATDLDRALSWVGAKEDGLIWRDGENLAVRLAALHDTATEIEQIRAQSPFAWMDGLDMSLDPLARALSTVEQIAATSGPLQIVEQLRAVDRPVATLAALLAERQAWSEAVTAWRSAWNHLDEATGLKPSALPADGDWNLAADQLKAMAKDREGARLTAGLLLYRSALDEVGLTAFVDAALAGEIKGEELADLFEMLSIRDLLTTYIGGSGAELGRLGSLTLEAARKAFARIDAELHELEASAIVATRLSDTGVRGVGSGPRGIWTEMELLNHEIGLKRPRTALRDVVHRAGHSLQALKPVWMMSPTSAAQFIRPNSLSFDLLVIDEASQMRPEFAVSALLRSSQIVIVGDANQLPPTDFFDATANPDDGDDDTTVQVDTESILDLANQRLRRKRRLKWHYRSQHESLIQFSNRQFYDRDLVVFPSPTIDDDLLGVKNHYVTGAVYEASINQREAEAVIEEAFRLMRTYPERSLGIVTMNSKQTELIQNEFERLTLEAPEVRRYIEEYQGSIDEFFIKNLENVQGDERDIMLISTVYGPDKDGIVRQRFGPMNREVGWRRLNVLVTRAKLSTRVFTSLRPGDIKITEKSSRGLIAFQAYLNYAAGGATADDASGGEPDSDFEVFVADALRDAGYTAVPQVGVEKFRIDLGVKHPDFPLGFIAGIECDGASYHSGFTVRDRDRIRQSVLEGMGWRIYRIWSTDWFGDPARELAKLLAQLDRWRADAIAANPRKATDEEPSSPPAPAGSTGHIIAEQTTVPARSIVDVPPVAPIDTAPVVPDAPSGRAMRPIDDIDWYEMQQSTLYEVWLDGRYAGEVECLSRGSGGGVYSGRSRVTLPEYEGRMADTGERFLMRDIYAAVREVARRARQQLRGS